MAAVLHDRALRRPRRAHGRVRLLCLPHAGGGASAYRSWSDILPADIEVWAAQLPGREDRIKDPPFVRLPPLVEELTDLLLPHLDVPFAFFGHSMGALVAFELARHLRRRCGWTPAGLVVAAHHAPQLPDPEPPIHRLPDDHFLAAVQRLNGAPSEALLHPELQSLLLPALRADLAVCETYEYHDEPPLDCPIAAFAAADDARVGRDEMLPWAAQTRGGFTLRMFPGNHFFVASCRELLLQVLASHLAGISSVEDGRAPRHA
jgi:medium-chain acyl-[acyl-carrier-protein] hydrolase